MGEFPHQRALVEQFKDQPFTILGINTDDDPDEYRKKCIEHNISWPSIFNGCGVPEEWGVSSYPTTFLIDSKGVIRYKNLRGKAMAPKIAELLAEMKK